MKSLVEVASRAGYTVISHKALTVIEVEGPGEWRVLELACRQFVRHSHAGHSYDHFSVIVRHADGTRDLRDVGINSVRYAVLPGVGFKWKRTYAGCGIRGAKQEGNRWRCLVKAHGVQHYIGVFGTKEEAGRARDRFVIENGLSVTLNYPEVLTV